MPNLRKGESKSAFISRCIKDVVAEGKSVKQATAQCYSMYQQQAKAKSQK